VSEKQIVKVVRSVRAAVDDDGREVTAYLLDNDGFQIEWLRPDADSSSNAVHATRVQLTPESFAVTAQVLAGMIRTLAEEAGDDPVGDNHGFDPGLNPDTEDAERYRKWRDGACYRPAEIAKSLAQCITPSDIDQAIDRLN